MLHPLEILRHHDTTRMKVKHFFPQNRRQSEKTKLCSKDEDIIIPADHIFTMPVKTLTPQTTTCMSSNHRTCIHYILSSSASRLVGHFLWLSQRYGCHASLDGPSVSARHLIFIFFINLVRMVCRDGCWIGD